MNERKIVLPGEFLGEKRGRKTKNAYLEGEKVYSKVLGILKVTDNEISVIPLAGKYMPKVGDRVVGVIWIKGKDKSKVIKALLTIDREAHVFGLTEKIEKMLGE